MTTKKFIHNNETAVKIKYNNRFKFYEALTAAINPKTAVKIQKYGNDLNITGKTIKEVKDKIVNILND